MQKALQYRYIYIYIFIIARKGEREREKAAQWSLSVFRRRSCFTGFGLNFGDVNGGSRTQQSRDESMSEAPRPGGAKGKVTVTVHSTGGKDLNSSERR